MHGSFQLMDNLSSEFLTEGQRLEYRTARMVSR
jgi:hypothetical protein